MDPNIPPTNRHQSNTRSNPASYPSQRANPPPDPGPSNSRPAQPSRSRSGEGRPRAQGERPGQGRSEGRPEKRDEGRERSAGQGEEAERERERIGDYYLGNEIGRGSFATVFKGYRVKTRYPIAIKAVSRSKLTPKLLENLEGEINILKAISHARVVELEDCIKTDHHIYLIMAFCSGGDLSIYIKKRGRLPTLDYFPFEGAEEKVFWPHPKEGGLDGRVARCFLGQLADALQFLRARNLIHRDIKPQNLLLHPPSDQDYANGHPLGIPLLKVADFGFARILPAATLAETLCGSPLYMAPEILRYEKYDAKADLWSVGAVLFEMLVGRPPFRAQNYVELLRKIEKNEDRIKFPDERSARELEAAAAEQQQSLPGIVPVAEDIKSLIRKLLKRVPIQRMSYEDFFSCGVWDGYMTVQRPKVASPVLPRPQMQRNASSSSSVGRVSAIVGGESPNMQRRPSQAKYATPSPPLRPADPAVMPSPRMAHVKPIEIRSRAGSDAVHNALEPASAPTAMDRPSVPKRYNTMGQRPGMRRDSLTPELGTPPPQDLIGTSKDRQTLSRLSTSQGSGMAMSARREPSALASQVGLQDSILGDQYVVVEKRNVEVNAMADELEAVAKRPDGMVRRRSSRLSALTRPMVSMTSGSSMHPSASSSSPISYSPPFTLSSTPPFAIAAGHQRKPSLQSLGSSPTVHTRARPILVPHAATTYGTSMTYQQAAQEARYPESPPVGPAHSLARAISYAGNMKLFGSPINAIGSFSRKPWLRSRQAPLPREADSGEEAVLQDLEDLSQKAFVLSELANSKLAICLNAPRLSTSSGAMASANLNIGQSPNLSAAAVYPYQGSLTLRRRSSSASISSSDLTAARVEILCAEALVLHLKALAFLQAGVEKAKVYWDQKAAVSEVVHSSPEFNETVQWFRTRFNDSFDRAEWAKSRCPEEMPESATYVEKLIYDKAIELSRSAAVTELVGDDLFAAEAGYENALWLLQAVLDGLMYEGQEVGDSDRITIEKVVVSIRVRLDTLQRKISLAQSAGAPVIHD